MRRHLSLAAGALIALATSSVSAATETKLERIDGLDCMVLENKHVRFVVVPEIGGSVSEFVHKKTGHNYVAGKVGLKEDGTPRVGLGWVDYTRVPAPDGPDKFFGAERYEAEFTKGKGYKGILARCTVSPYRIEREMRLMDRGPEVVVIIKQTNVGQEPHPLWIRWHPWCLAPDLHAENSCVISPGEPGIIRKITVGWGFDNWLYTRDGYWLVANYKSGEGLWLTYEKENSEIHFTWTDHKYRKHPMRGAVTMEPYPMPVPGKPGESVSLAMSYRAFTAEDAPESLSMGVLTDGQEIARAKTFLKTVKPNLAHIGPFTQIPPKNQGWQSFPANRFGHNHRRRDRMAIRPWGFADAMLRPNCLHKVPASVEKAVKVYYPDSGPVWLNKLGLRVRYYAQLFPGAKGPKNLTYRVTATDEQGKVQVEEKSVFSLSPDGQKLVDERGQVGLGSLPDGRYVFAVEIYEDDAPVAMHRYETLPQTLVGNRHAEILKRGRQPWKETPFVAALAKIDPGKLEGGTASVPVGVENGSAVARKQWPVRVGVPFPKGAVSRDTGVVLSDPRGKPVPVQTKVMAVWTDNSLRWLLVDFRADVPAKGHMFYQLRTAPKPESPAPTPIIADKGDHFLTDTGLEQTQIAKAGGERLLGYFAPGDLWWTDGKGDKYSFQLKGEGAGIEIEENGNLRAVLKTTGWYFNDQGRAVCMGELRWEFYRGQSHSRLFHTVVFCGSPTEDALGSYGISFRTGEGRYNRIQMEGDGRVGATGKSLVLHQSEHSRFEVTADGKPGKPGRRCAGAVQLTGAKETLSVYHRDLWQMYPKKITADAASGVVTFAYWPEEAGVLRFMPREEGWIPSSSDSRICATGLSRTHEFIIETKVRRPVQSFETTFNEPVICAVPPRWLRSTWAMLHLSPYDSQTHPGLEQHLRDLIAAYERHREVFGWYGEWVYGGIPNFFRKDFYGWIDFGRYAWILNEQDIVNTPWLLFYRSGDRRFFKFAESNTRHLLEVATIRWNPLWPRDVGFSRRHHECIWLGAGDKGHSMLDPFVNYYHATGYRPAWDAALRMGHGMKYTFDSSWRYISNPLAGCSRLYLETNDPQWKEAADKIWTRVCEPDRNRWYGGDHGDRAAMWYSQLNPKVGELTFEYATTKKDYFTGLDVLSFLFLQKKHEPFALEVAKKLPTPLLPGEEADPFMYPIKTITQYELAAARAMCYMGEVAAEGLKLEKGGK